MDSFNNSLKLLFQNNDYRKTFEFLDIENENDLREFMHRWLTPEMIRRCRVSLGTLGGGNHFFELQQVIESDSEDFKKGDYITVLHTDSISVGISVLSLFSNLNEFDYLPLGKRWYKKLVGRYNQFRHFSKIKIQGRQDIIDLAVLLFGKDPKRSVSVKSVIGKNIIEGFLFSSVFGEMNRTTIIEAFQDFSGLEVLDVNSTSHDSVFIENDIHGNTCVIQRNGVQRVGRNKNFILPGALGTEAYIFKSNGNQILIIPPTMA
jgi:hypothetical protein